MRHSSTALYPDRTVHRLSDLDIQSNWYLWSGDILLFSVRAGWMMDTVTLFISKIEGYKERQYNYH
jgi:hypothetical protein